ncbi:MAG: hypothetical protein ACO3A4_08890 [Silvanigrellaceae bacterium]
MTDVKKLMTEIQKFVDSSSKELLNSVVSAFTGSEFSTNIELKKNKETAKYLSENSKREKSLKELNDFIVLWLEVVEKKMMHQQLLDFSGAAEDVLKQLADSDPNLDIILRDFQSLISRPTEFVDDYMALRNETDELEGRLTQLVSLPVLEDVDSAQWIEPFKLMPAFPNQPTRSALKILTSTSVESNESKAPMTVVAPSNVPSPSPRPENYRPLPANISDEFEYPESLLVITKPPVKKANTSATRTVKLRG